MALKSLKEQLSTHENDKEKIKKMIELIDATLTESIFGDGVVQATTEEVLSSCYPPDVMAELYIIFEGLSRVLKRHNIEHWLSFGSAIGALRHGSIIPWDDDIDISMWYRDFDQLVGLEEELLELGIGLSLTWHHHSNLWSSTMFRAYLVKEEMAFKADGKTPAINIDIFFMEEKEGTIRYMYDNYPRASYKVDGFYPLRSINLGPVSTFIPSNASEAIASDYGADWDTQAFLHIFDNYKMEFHKGARRVFSEENLLTMPAKQWSEWTS